MEPPILLNQKTSIFEKLFNQYNTANRLRWDWFLQSMQECGCWCIFISAALNVIGEKCATTGEVF